MSHNWISCRNAPLLTLLASARHHSPREPLAVAGHSGEPWMRTGIFPNHLPAPEWHSSADPVSHQAFPVFKSQPLSPAPLDWGPSHCTWQTSSVFPLRNKGWNCRTLHGAHWFQHFSHCPAWFPIHFKFQTLILGFLLLVLAILSGDLLQITWFYAKSIPYPSLKFIQLS